MGAEACWGGPAAAGAAALGIAAAAGTTDQRGPPDEGCIRDELFAAIQSAPFSDEPEDLPDGIAVRLQKEAARQGTCGLGTGVIICTRPAGLHMWVLSWRAESHEEPCRALWCVL